MANATSTTYLQIESIGADKLIASMNDLKKSMNFVAGMLKDLNRGLGIMPSTAKKGAAAMDEQAEATKRAVEQSNQLRLAMASQMAATADLGNEIKNLKKKHEEGVDWTALKSKLDLAKDAFNLIKSAMISVGKQALELSAAYETQIQAETRLQNALKNLGIDKQIGEFKSWASELQNSTIFGDEFIMNLAAQAGQFAKTGEQTKKATKVALDFSAATGKDAAEALKAVGSAVKGNASGLKTLGVYLDENEKEFIKNADEAERFDFVVEKLSATYGGFAELLAQTPSGALQQALNIVGDIKEQVGELVAPATYAVFDVVTDDLKSIQSTITDILGDERAIDKIQQQIVVGIATTVATAVDLKNVFVTLKNSVEIFATALGAAFGALIKPLGMFFEQLSNIQLLPDEMQRNFAKIGLTLSLPFDAAKDAIKGDIKDIKDAWTDAEKYDNQLLARLTASAGKYTDALKKRQELLGQQSQPTGKGKAPGAKSAKTTAKEEGFTVELDAEFQAFMDYQAKMDAARADFAAKRAALEQSAIIDYESKLEYKKQLDEQEQQALLNLKLEYARQTGDQLTLIEERYRQEREAKEIAAEKVLAEQKNAIMQSLANNIKSVGSLGLEMLTGWIEGTGDWREQLYEGMKSFSKNLMSTAIASIIDQALVNQSKAQGSQAGIPIVGPALALAAGIAMFATTMGLKSKLKPAEVQYATGGYISAGMVRGGAYGRDSVPALLEPGERVLSKQETAVYDEQRATPQPVNITINISGQLSTPAQITDTVRRVLVPEIRSAVRAGYTLG